jgi:adenosylcobyric acid synthase
VLLVADIERGGALAHLYGTWALLEPAERDRLQGFVLNRFRGDRALLDPAPAMLRDRTGVPVLAVIPHITHGLPDEDGAAAPPVAGGRPRVAIVRYPRASNLDEFKVLEQVADIVWARRPGELAGAALVVLPGSKHTAADLAWLREQELDRAIAGAGRVLGICGGLQMLGARIADPHGVEGAATGLGLLPVRTTLAADKATRRTTARFAARLPAPWAAVVGLDVSGYEIRHGHTVADGAAPALSRGLGWVSGPFLGVTLHGLFEQPRFAAALLGAAPARTLDDELDRLADAVAAHLDVDALLEDLP